MDDRKKQALERAYARFLEEQAKAAQSEEELARAAAAKYAKYLKEQNMKPGEFKAKPEPATESTTPIDKIEEAVEAVVEKEESITQASAQPKEAEEVATEASEPKAEVASEPEKVNEASEPKKASNKKNKKDRKKSNKSKSAKRERKPVEELGYFHPRMLLYDCLLTIEAFGDLLAALVDVHDRVQARIDSVLIELWKSLRFEFYSMTRRYRASRRRIGFAFMSMIALSCAMLLVFDYFTVYEYAYNGRVLGYVDNQEYVTDVLDVAGDQLAKNNHIPIEFKSGDNITFKKVSASNKTVDSSDEAVNKLAYMTDIEVNAFGIYEDDKLVTVVESDAGAKNAINQAKRLQSKPDEGMKVISVDFVNSIEVKPITVMITSVQSQKNAVEQLTEGGNIEIYHIVDNGETIKSIASHFGVDEASVCDSETKETIKSINTGDKVLIKKAIEPIKIKMVEDGTMSEVIKFKQVRQETSSLYKGDTEIKQQGVDGKQIVTGKVTKVNGEITKRKLKSKEVINEAQDEITLVGTSERPKTAPTGSYGMPIRNYVITSEFGYRWGRNHDGIDFGASTGTPIYAADGGTVIVSGYSGGYGLCVDIDHGNGKKTRYGHCSSIYVGVGEKVYKGQEIAAVGSTGNSTGPHLHFEIRSGGTALDPGPILGVY